MITRFPGLTPTRSRAVATDDLVFTVAVAPDPVGRSVYEQSVQMLARVDESLALCASNKSKVLAATIYLNDVTCKAEFNRAWDAWVDPKNPPARAAPRGTPRPARRGRGWRPGGKDRPSAR